MSDQPNVFEGQPSQEQPSDSNQSVALSKLVGEDKKFKSVEDLARGKLESDLLIEELKVKLARKEEEAAKESSAKSKLDDILQKLEQNKNPNSGDNTNPVLDEDKIAKIVQAQMTNAEKRRTAEQNIDTTNAKLNEIYGDKAKERVEAKAKELGISMAKLKEISSESPSAFYSMIGISDVKKETPASPNKSSVNTAAKEFAPDYKVGTKEYYKELRRKDPIEYYNKHIFEVMDKVKKGELVL